MLIKSSLILMVALAFALPAAAAPIYTPGETLDPACGPSDVDCTVGYPINFLSDVDTATVAPVTNDILIFNGTVWTPTSTAAVSNSLFTDSGATTYLTQTSDSLAIGTTTASQKLTVAGNIDLIENGAIFINGAKWFAASTASSSTMVGEDAGENNAGNSNNFFGYQAGQNNTGSKNNFFGQYAGLLNAGADSNLIGIYAGYENTGSNNNIIGPAAGYQNTGSFNNLFGHFAGSFNKGSNNNILGQNAGYRNAGSSNNIIGYETGSNNSGNYNNLLGYQAGQNNTGSNNNFFGYLTGQFLQATSSDIIGSEAFRGSSISIYQAVNNVALGYRAGYAAQTGASNNILLGYKAADNITTGANNIVLGYDVDLPTPSGSNQLTIGNLIYGTGINGTGTTLSTGNIGIGTSTPNTKLAVKDSSISTGGVFTLEDADSTCIFTADSSSGPTCGSDRTLKKDISLIENELDLITQLEPKFWRFKTDDSNDPLKSGFIAQDVEGVLPELVTENTWIDGTEKKFLNINGMIPYIVGAIKELYEMVTGIEEKVKGNEEEIMRLKSELCEKDDSYEWCTNTTPQTELTTSTATTTEPSSASSTHTTSTTAESSEPTATTAPEQATTTPTASTTEETSTDTNATSSSETESEPTSATTKNETEETSTTTPTASSSLSTSSS